MNPWLIAALIGGGIFLGVVGVFIYFLYVFTDGFKNLGPFG